MSPRSRPPTSSFTSGSTGKPQGSRGPLTPNVCRPVSPPARTLFRLQARRRYGPMFPLLRFRFLSLGDVGARCLAAGRLVVVSFELFRAIPEGFSAAALPGGRSPSSTQTPLRVSRCLTGQTACPGFAPLSLRPRRLRRRSTRRHRTRCVDDAPMAISRPRPCQTCYGNHRDGTVPRGPHRPDAARRPRRARTASSEKTHFLAGRSACADGPPAKEVSEGRGQRARSGVWRRQASASGFISIVPELTPRPAFVDGMYRSGDLGPLPGRRPKLVGPRPAATGQVQDQRLSA